MKTILLLEKFLEKKKMVTIEEVRNFAVKQKTILHIAIFSEPFLSYFLNGKKTLESHFSKNKSLPFGKVKAGDILLLKSSGGPLKGICIVTKTSYFGPLTRQKIQELMLKYEKELCLTEEFKKLKQYSRYVSLFTIGEILEVTVNISKKDPRSWIILKDASNTSQAFS